MARHAVSKEVSMMIQGAFNNDRGKKSITFLRGKGGKASRLEAEKEEKRG